MIGLVIALPSFAQPFMLRRYRFSSAGTQVTLVYRSEPIQMSFQDSERAHSPGGWFEVQDATDKVLYERPVYNMLGLTIEAPADDMKSMRHVTVKEPKSLFEALVPELPSAKVIVLFASPDGTSAAKETGNQIIKAKTRRPGSPRERRRPELAVHSVAAR